MLIGRVNKRKRGMDENGGPLSEPVEGAPATYTTSRSEKRKREAKVGDTEQVLLFNVSNVSVSDQL